MFERVEDVRDGEKLEAACVLLTQLYPERGLPRIREEIGRMLAQEGWRMVGIFDGEECVATMLVHVGHRMYCGKFIRMDSMVIDEDRRSAGLGKVLMDWVEKEGRRLNCDLLLLDSFVTNHNGHRFFFREGAQISGYHFTLALK
jgi:GNAT superfamily N-acetyltransferase